MSRTGRQGMDRLRVCDNCIRQKVKCDLGKPTCCRCLERGLGCSYSSVRRQPGPAPGSRRARPSQTNRVAVHQARPSSPNTEVHTNSGPSPSPQNIPLVETSSFSSPSTLERLGLEDVATVRSLPDALPITSQEKVSLLTWYFENINHAIPLFLDHDSTSEDRARGAVAACSPDVVEAMIVVTAKLSRRGLSFMTDGELCAHIDRILGTSSLRDDIASDSSSLDQFRQSCILAFYEHHQCPGQQAWMRVGKLVRAAYWSGLDQIERMRETSHRWKALTEQEVEEWRLVWWCAYCLDSYANVSTGMPCGIDERYVNTTLPREAIMIGRNRVSLPTRPEGLVDVVRTVFAESPPKAAAREMQLLSIAVLRDIGRTIQQRAVMSPEELVVSVENAERRLYALRLALPCNFFHPSRNVFESESAPDHHLRLVTIHHILMAQILITICHCRRLPEGDDWVHSWQRVLELCQDVVALARQWNSSFCLSVDPALSIIAFVSLVFLDLHIKFATGTNETSASSTLLAELEHCETILLLFLERFGESWTLSRLLIFSFRGFKEALPGSIKYRQVQAILRHFDSPLHPRWLTFLQSAGDISQSYC